MTSTAHELVDPCPDYPVVILAGQSNAVGQAGSDYLDPPYDQPHPTVEIWADSYSSIDPSVAGQWLPLSPQFGRYLNRFGPEVGLGFKLADALDPETRIIKYSRDGTSLHSNWTQSPVTDYGLMLDTVTDALAALDAQAIDHHLVGFVWIQGEADASDVTWASEYASRFASFVAYLRQDLGEPTLPIYVGRISKFATWAYADVVRAAEAEVCDSANGVFCFDMNDLPVDSLGHYTTPGALTLGLRAGEMLVMD